MEYITLPLVSAEVGTVSFGRQKGSSRQDSISGLSCYGYRWPPEGKLSHRTSQAAQPFLLM